MCTACLAAPSHRYSDFSCKIVPGGPQQCTVTNTVDRSVAEVINKSKELVTEHVVVHARTGKWASEHVEFIQDAAHAPNVLKQKLSTYLAMQIPSLKLPSASDKFQFTYEVKMPFACGCLRWHNQGGLQQCRYRLCSKRSLQLVRDTKRHKMCFQASDLNE